ncbi:hypothetical protein HT136_20860 [Novosphingobium profundi]|uniref:hypothetical protein n=1 Tax=Novosphingobium profundi TaxID=1774954 RepID=UPI001BDA9958|nr:hypothetical protein [Novosphingobium profundi]MBT0670822.1 hypothetical protein [Novosphingobium profundi]
MTTRWERAGLYAVLDGYLEALLARDPARVGWAAKVLHTENNVALAPGDGLWGTITGRGSYDLRFCDPETGQVALFTTVIESGDESAASLRLGVTPGGLICEVELIVVRARDEALRFPDPRFETKPVLEAMVPEVERMTRERLISVANGYFATLEQNDGQLFTAFHPDCQRVENGTQTTNNPAFMLPIAKLGCEAQFRLGWYRYDDRLRGRRFPLVDVARGLVLAHGFIDHCGRLERYRLTDGTEVESHIRRPHTFYLSEVFKIEHGAIRQVEANFITVPYHMPSPWDAREAGA